MHLEASSALLWLAAIVVAWGTVYRGLVRPLVGAMRRLGDELSGLRESTQMMRELVQYVAGFVVHTEGRLAQLEVMLSIVPSETEPTYHRHKDALDWLERNAQRRDRRASDRPTDHKE